MFRFSIRELMLTTLVACMGTAWALEHRSLVEVREDAKSLAQYGDPHRGACGNVAGFWSLVASKYVDRGSYEPEFLIRDEDEAALGVDP